MVQIKIKPILLTLMVFILVAGAAHAAGSKLIFSDLDVKVGGKTDKNVNDGETVSEEAMPGDTIQLKIEMKNNFTSAEDLDIEDIRVEATIEEIDDGDDLDEESNEFDLSAGRDKSVTLKFEVPLEVDEDTFDVLLEAEGEDQNGTDHRATMKIKIEVEKENHKLIITRKALSPADVTCNRKNVQASVSILNIGSEDEEDVTVQVLNSELGVDIKEKIGELEAEPNEETSRFSKIYTFNVPNSAEAGSYPVIFRALYDDDRRKAEETVTLNVNRCGTEQEEQQTTGGVTIVTPPAQTVTPTQPVQITVPPDTTVTSEGFFKSNAFVIAVIIAEVIAVIIGIVLIVALFARRD